MRRLFTQEGQKYNVFPIDNARTKRLDVSNRPSLMGARRSVTFFQGMIRTPEGAAPDTKNKDFNLTVSESGACVRVRQPPFISALCAT